MERERAEVVRLEGLLRELEEANNSMYHHLQQKDQELDHYAREIDEMQRQETQLRLEVESYQRQLENLSQDYEFTRGELKQITGDREALRAERNWKKDLAGQSEDWRARQEQRYLQLQQEFDRKRHEVDQLREDVRKLEALLSEERARSFRLSRQVEGEEGASVGVRSGVVGRALVESRVESYHSENENSSNLHSRSRSESESNVSASMENIRRISEQFFLTTKPNIRS
jgi:chromosome segregation ATPase